MHIKTEKSSYHVFALYYDYDPIKVEFCRALKETYGSDKFTFNSDQGLKRWVFSDPVIVQEIVTAFPSAVVEADVAHEVAVSFKYYAAMETQQEEVKVIQQKKDTDIVIKGINGELYPYQKVGVEFLIASGGRAIIADVPGLGKSIQALAYIAHQDFTRSLIVAPASVKSSWVKEVKKWTKMSYVEIDSKTNLAKIPADVQLWIINYDILKKHLDTLLKTRFDVVVSDECVVGETLISTNNGYKQIKDILPGDMVLSFNEKTREAEYKKVVKLHINKRNDRDIVSVGNLRCTADHRVFDGNEYVEAAYVTSTFPIQRPALKVGTSDQVMFGTLMGDGSLQKNAPIEGMPNNISPRLKVGHHIRHHDLVMLKAKAIKYFDPARIEKLWNPGYKPDWFLRIASRALPELHDLYNELYEMVDGKKVNKVSLSFLNGMGVPGLAIWIQDDGTCNRGGIHLCSYRYGLEGNQIIKNWFNETYGLKCSIYTDKQPGNRIFYGIAFKNEDSTKLYSLIRDYIVPSMYKKFAWQEEKFTYLPSKHCVNCGKKIVKHMRHKHANFCSVECYKHPKSVSKYIPDIVYDLEVEDNHNYFADGILIHNCHMVKSRTAMRTKALMSIAKHVPHVVLLSGTPLLSRPIEMYTLLNMVDPKIWNNWYDFTRRYCGGHQGRFGYETGGATNTEELHERIKRHFIRRKKKDVLQQLPPKIRIDVPVELEPSIRRQYDAAENDLVEYLLQYKRKQPAEIAKVIAAEQLAKLNILRQLSALGKIPTAIDLIDSVLEAGEKILVFSSFMEPLRQLQEKYATKSVMLTGETPVSDRGAIVTKFQEDPNVQIFFGGVRSAGVGITLTAAQNCLMLDYSWNPADMQQAEDRLHRPGQTAFSVNIYQLHADNTIDEKMLKLLKHKQLIFDKVIEGVAISKEDKLASKQAFREVVGDVLERNKKSVTEVSIEEFAELFA